MSMPVASTCLTPSAYEPSGAKVTIGPEKAARAIESTTVPSLHETMRRGLLEL